MKRSALIVFAIIFLVCFSQAVYAKDPQPQYGGVLNIVNPRGPDVFGYPPKVRGYGGKFLYATLEQLCSTDSAGRFTPLLATAYELSADGKSITFTLRKGVKFHDGTDFNAKVAKWNLELAKEARKPGTQLWTSIEVVDDYTLRVGLRMFQNNWPSTLSGNSHMISPTAVEKNGEQWAYHHPVGTGPFKFKAFKRDVFLEFERNDDYWGPKPYLDGIKYLIIKDPMTQMASWQKGTGDVLETRTIKLVHDLTSKGYKTDVNYILIVGLVPDAANPDSPFADERVRQAVEYAIDRPAITQALGYGLWKASNQTCPRSNIAYNPDLAGRAYDPEKAKKLLAAAGYPKGFKTQIIQEPMDKNATTLIQSYLQAVGIEAELNIVNRARIMEYEQKGWKNGFIFKGFGFGANTADSLNRYLEVNGRRLKSAIRPDGWKNLVEDALSQRDFESQKAMNQKTVKFVYDNSMVIPLWEIPELAVLRQNVYETNFYTPTITRWTPGKAYFAK